MVIPAIWYLFCARLAFTAHLAQLYEQYGSFEVLWTELTQAVWCRSTQHQKGWQRIVEVRRNLPFYQAIWRGYQAEGMWFITWLDNDYPELLRHIYAPPLILCGQGNRKLVSKTCVSIVGTRRATAYGKSITAQIVQVLAPYDVLFVSGLAYGIDSVVHTTADRLQAGSVGVIAASLLHQNWGGNAELKQQLSEQHLFLSETNSDERVQRFHFAKRNRLIAGLSKWTIVVEAPLGSGALITARLARDEGREVLVVPHSLDQPMGEGCLLLINDGAQIVVQVSDIPRLLNFTDVKQNTILQFRYASELEKTVHQLMLSGNSIESIADKLAIASSELLTVLTDLMLKGYLIQNADGSYQVS